MWPSYPGIVAAIEGVQPPGGADFTVSAGLIRPVIAALHDWASWADRGARYVDTFAGSRRGIYGRWKTFPEARVTKIEQGVREGKVTQLHFRVASDPDRTRRGEFTLHVALTLGEADFTAPGKKRVIGAPRVGFELVRSDEPARHLHALDDVELVCALFAAVVSVVTPANGFAAPEDGGDVFWFPLNWHVLKRSEGFMSDKALGYDWVELLTPKMVEELKRHGRDLASIPAELVQQIDYGEGHRCMLVAPKRSPFAVTDDDMRRFREFISPVLICHGPPPEGSFGHQHWSVNRKPRPRNLLPDDWFQSDD